MIAATELLSPIIELRQYELQPGKRDDLIALFERELIEGQEDCGMRIVGQFRDLDDPDNFVWLRGFSDMWSRAEALTAFYNTGPVWAANSAAARATMVDTDNAVLLRPVTSRSGFLAPARKRPQNGAGEPGTSRVVATTYHRAEPVDDGFRAYWHERVQPLMIELEAEPIAWFETEPAENTYPLLPVRTGEHLFVWFQRFESAGHLEAHETALGRSAEWNQEILPALAATLSRPPERLRLEPTPRSLLR